MPMRTLLFIMDRPTSAMWDTGAKCSHIGHALEKEPAFQQASHLICQFDSFDFINWESYKCRAYRTLLHCPTTNIAFFETLYTHPGLNPFDIVLCGKRDIPASVTDKIGKIHAMPDLSYLFRQHHRIPSCHKRPHNY